MSEQISGLPDLEGDTVRDFARYWEAVFNEGDYRAIAGYYTLDARLIAAQAETVWGHPAIERFWQDATARAKAAGVRRTVQADEAGSDGPVPDAVEAGGGRPLADSCRHLQPEPAPRLTDAAPPAQAQRTAAFRVRACRRHRSCAIRLPTWLRADAERRLAASDRLSFSALSVLHTLSRLGPCRLSDLVRTEQIKQPALTSAVAKLERDGLIERRPDPRDGRASMLSLTADGQSVVSRRHADRVERLRTLIDRLPLADRNRLLSIAGVLDQIVRLAGEQDERPDVRSGK